MKYMKPLIAVLFAVQLAIPAYMIYEQNQILADGVVYKFKTRPIDPYDPFRGRYVTLRYEANAEPIEADVILRKGDWVYITLIENDKGFAEFNDLSVEQPKSGDFIKAEVGWGDQDRGYYIRLPFTRYYAQEDVAPKIEQSVWRRQGDELDDVYAEVSVLKGKATLKELFIEGLPVREYIKLKVEP